MRKGFLSQVVTVQPGRQGFTTAICQNLQRHRPLEPSTTWDSETKKKELKDKFKNSKMVSAKTQTSESDLPNREEQDGEWALFLCQKKNVRGREGGRRRKEWVWQLLKLPVRDVTAEKTKNIRDASSPEHRCAGNGDVVEVECMRS